MGKENVRKIDISYKSMLFPFVVVLSLWLFTQIWDILLVLFVSFLFMTALRPLVDGLEKLRFPRVLSILVVYSFIIFLFSFILAEIIPSLIQQTTRFMQLLPSILNKTLPIASGIGIDAQSFGSQIAPLGEGVVKVTFQLFANFFTFLAIFVFSFYFLMERGKANYYLKLFTGREVGDKLYKVLLSVEDKLGAWVRGQVFLMLYVLLADYLGLLLLKVEFALPLAILAGLFELVPVIGPISAGVIAVLVAFSVSPFLALSVAALYFIVQQVQNAVVVPFVMSKSVGVSPLMTIIALFIGSRFLGIGAAILTIPMFLVIQVVIRTLLTIKEEEKLEAHAPVEIRKSKKV